MFCATVCLSPNTAGQDVSRAGKFEIGGAFQWFGGETMDGSVEGEAGDLKFDDVFTGGLHFGYNISEQLNLNTEFVFGTTDLSFSNAAGRVSDKADFLAWTVNVEYYVLPTAFTPYVNAGIGIIGLENEYESDGWYAYRRDRELPLSEVNFLWNVGAGLRWDPIDHLYLKLGYRLNGTQFDYSDEYMLLHSVLFTAGYSFGR
ncbi:MAG: outer membrane protein [Limisphaerales bacterium]